MSDLTIDFQDITQSCPHCDESFTISRGSVYDESEGVSIYLAALHACGDQPTVHVTVAVKEGYSSFTETCAASLQIINGGENFEMSLIDPEYSPWKDVEYLGRMLRRDEVINGSLKETFFHIADHIAMENPTVNAYLTEAKP